MGVIVRVLEESTGAVVVTAPVSVKTVVTDADLAPIKLNVMTGAPGRSAYEVAVQNGFVGTVTEWLASLKGDPGGPGSGGVVDLSDYYTISEVDFLVNEKEAAIPAGTTAQYLRGDKTWGTLDKTAVGLSAVDNTSDANKPISTAVATALAGKASSVHTHTSSSITDLTAVLDARIQTVVGAAPAALDTLDELAAALGDDANFAATVTTQLAGKQATIPVGTTAQYYRGDKTWQTLNSAAVGLPNVNNTSDTQKPVSVAMQTALDGKENVIAAGTTTQYLRGDKTWQTLNSAAVGLGSVNNTADLAKPISTATQTALDGKAAAVHTHASTSITDFATAVDARITAAGAAGPTVANIPAGSILVVKKSTAGAWPARPTSRSDVTVAWQGADPSPVIVASGTGGMLDNVDVRWVTT